MCESNVYLRDEAGERLVMEDVVLLERAGEKLRIANILGEEKELEGTVEEITFLDHRIFIRA